MLYYKIHYTDFENSVYFSHTVPQCETVALPTVRGHQNRNGSQSLPFGDFPEILVKIREIDFHEKFHFALFSICLSPIVYNKGVTGVQIPNKAQFECK